MFSPKALVPAYYWTGSCIDPDTRVAPLPPSYQVPLGVLLVWQLGRLLALVVWVIAAYIKRQKDGSNSSVLTSREMTLTGYYVVLN